MGLEDYLLPTKEASVRDGAVTLKLAKRGVWIDVTCGLFSSRRNGPECNLCAIKEAVRSARLADQRGIGPIFAELGKLLALPQGDSAGSGPHQILGVEFGAEMARLKAAYRSRIKETHPDVPGGNREEFESVQAAARELGVLP